MWPYLAGLGGGVVLLLLIIGVVYGVSSSTDSEQQSGSAAPAATAPAPQRAIQTPGQAVYSWYKSGGESVLNTLSRDFQSVGTAGVNHDVAALATACTSLQNDVEAAQVYTPIPDAEAQAHFAAALDQHARAATDCLAGITGYNGSLFTKAAREMNAGTAEIGKATGRIQALQGN